LLKADKKFVGFSFDNKFVKIESLKKYKCKYIIQDKQLGTGHSARTIFKNNIKLENSVIILLGDHPLISSNTIKKLNSIHNSKKSLITIITAKVPNYKNIYSHFYDDGRILRNSKKEIIDIIEPSDATLQETKIKEINPSLYIFNTVWLKNNINKIKINKKKKEYYLTDIIKIAVEQGVKINSITIDVKECFGVNTQKELKQIESLLQKNISIGESNIFIR